MSRGLPDPPCGVADGMGFVRSVWGAMGRKSGVPEVLPSSDPAAAESEDAQQNKQVKEKRPERAAFYTS